MVTPRCPYCNAQGLEHLALKRLDLFGLVYCGQCGAIYGVVSLSPASPPPPQEAAAAPPPPSKLAALTNQLQTQLEPKPASSPAPLRHPFKRPSNPPNLQQPQNFPADWLVEVGQADLNGKLPYDPQAMANRMRAAGLNQGSRYLHIAADEGPPCCPQHKVEMVRVTVPDGYQNAGRQVWLCPHFTDCHRWELAQ